MYRVSDFKTVSLWFSNLLQLQCQLRQVIIRRYLSSFACGVYLHWYFWYIFLDFWNFGTLLLVSIQIRTAKVSKGTNYCKKIYENTEKSRRKTIYPLRCNYHLLEWWSLVNRWFPGHFERKNPEASTWITGPFTFLG